MKNTVFLGVAASLLALTNGQVTRTITDATTTFVTTDAATSSSTSSADTTSTAAGSSTTSAAAPGTTTSSAAAPGSTTIVGGTTIVDGTTVNAGSTTIVGGTTIIDGTTVTGSTSVVAGTSAVGSSSTTRAAQPTNNPDTPTEGPLAGASLNNAEVVTLANGEQAVRMAAPANGEASIAVADVPVSDDVQDGEPIQVSLDVSVTTPPAQRKRQAEGPCTLVVELNGEVVFEQAIPADADTNTYTSAAGTFRGEGNTLNIIQRCGNTVVDFTISNVGVEAAPGGPTSDIPSSSVPVSSEVPSSSELPISDISSIISSIISDLPSSVSSDLPSSFSSVVSASASASASDFPDYGFPSEVNDFLFYGCVGSDEGFPTFEKRDSSPTMDIDVCTELCSDSQFAGIFAEDCYCGTTIDQDETDRVSTDLCNIECPGDDTQICGGENYDLRRSLRVRQNVPNSIFLTVYVNIEFKDEVVTVTKLVPTTVYKDGYPAVQTNTVYEPICVFCQPPKDVYCYNGYCHYADVILKPWDGASCYEGELVWVPYGNSYSPFRCSSGSCHGKTVYKPETCYDNCGDYAPVQEQKCDCEGGTEYVPKKPVYVPEQPAHPVVQQPPKQDDKPAPPPANPPANNKPVDNKPVDNKPAPPANPPANYPPANNKPVDNNKPVEAGATDNSAGGVFATVFGVVLAALVF